MVNKKKTHPLFAGDIEFILNKFADFRANYFIHCNYDDDLGNDENYAKLITGFYGRFLYGVENHRIYNMFMINVKTVFYFEIDIKYIHIIKFGHVMDRKAPNISYGSKKITLEKGYEL